MAPWRILHCRPPVLFFRRGLLRVLHSGGSPPQPGSSHCGGTLAQVPGVGHLGAGGVDGPSVHFVQAQFSVSTGAQQWPIQLRRQRGQLQVEEWVHVVGLGFSSGPPE